MSDLRDLTNALQTFSDRLTAIEECLAETAENGVQHREGLHDLRGKLQTSNLERDRSTLAIRQVQEWMGDFSHKQTEIHDMVTNLQSTRQSDIKDIGRRLRALEADDEATQP